MAFKFRLEKVLLHRRSLENIARKDYMLAIGDLEKEKKILNELYQKIDLAQIERHELVLKGGQYGEELRQYHEYIKGTEKRIERQKNVVSDKMAKVENLQQALQEATVNYKMIEKLEARQREDYRRAEKKLEEKNLTDMANVRFLSRRKNEQ